MSNKQKDSLETNEQFQGRLVRETMEDLILNDMIAHDKHILIDDNKSSDSLYNKSDPRRQEAYDQMVYQYFSDQFESLAEKHPRVYEGLDFTNFVKTLSIYDGFMDTLRDTRGLEPESIERVWQDVFNQDAGSFKISALNGFKRVLEGTSDPNTIADKKVGNINALMERTTKDIKELGSSLRGEVNNSQDEMHQIGREIINALAEDPLERGDNPIGSYNVGIKSPWDKI